MNPTQYDRMLIKNLRNMKEGGNAIFNTNALEYAFSDNEARKNLYLQSLADTKDSRDARMAENQRQFDIGLAENQRRFDSRMGEGKRQFDTASNMWAMQRKDADKADDTAEMFGWGDIMLGGVQGYNALKSEKKKTDQMDEMTQIIKQMVRR